MTNLNSTTELKNPNEQQSATALDKTSLDRLSVETSNPLGRINSPPINNPSNAKEKETHDGLIGETTSTYNTTNSAETDRNHATHDTSKNSSGLPVVTSRDTTEDNQNGLQVETNNKTQPEFHTGKPNKTICEENDGKELEESEAALGLIMLHEHDSSNNTLLEKYDNSLILPVDAAHQTDYSVEPEVDHVEKYNNTGHDSDNTIILQKEIEDIIRKNTEDGNNNTFSSDSL